MKKYHFFLCLFLFGLNSFGMDNSLFLKFDSLAKFIDNPSVRLEQEPVLRLGPSSINDANIIFLPEIHDDASSLENQLVVLANEKKQNQEVFVLDESLDSFKKSSWDLFSEKALEIVVAKENEQNNEKYTPKMFEKKLSNLAHQLTKVQGGLEFLSGKGIWSIPAFSIFSEPFYGWDNNSKNSSLISRNFYMIKSMDQALKIKPRVFLMLGARHVPDLEYLSSKNLLCNGQRFQTKDDYFSYIKKNFGSSPDLSLGIGSTLPIYEYLKDKKYAIIFNKQFYPKFNQVMQNFVKESGLSGCINL